MSFRKKPRLHHGSCVLPLVVLLLALEVQSRMGLVWLGRKTRALEWAIPVAMAVSKIYLVLLLNLLFYTECPNTIIFVQKRMEKKNKHMGGAFAGLPEPVRDWLPIDPVRRVYVEGRWSGSQQLEITQNRGNLL